MSAKTRHLNTELVEQAKQVSSIASNKVFTVYDLYDLIKIAEATGYPVIGVAYEGFTKNENDSQGQPEQKSGLFINHNYSILYCIDYDFGMDDQRKFTLMDIMEDVRNQIYGYRNVNTRPWILMGESPIDVDTLDGVIFYVQYWQTKIPIVSK